MNIKELTPKGGIRHPLKEFFRGRGISQVKLAELLRKEGFRGVHQSSLSRWLSGEPIKNQAIENRLQEIADALYQ